MRTLETDFFLNLKSRLVSLSNTSIIIGGDWNVVQYFSFDTDNYLHKHNLKSHDKDLEISSYVYLDLIDVWRKMHTEERRFTWHGPNRKQSRLDYFLISSDLEGFIKRSENGLSRPLPIDTIT
jgi:exonuclease III